MLSSKIYKYNKKKMKIDLSQIVKYANTLPFLFSNIKNDIKTNSWFNITEQKGINNLNNSIKTNLENKSENIIKSKCIIMKPTLEQRNILQEWFSSYTKMYNETIYYIRKKYNLTRHNIKHIKINQKELSFYTLRSELMNKKKEIMKKSNEKRAIYTHILDSAIKLCSANIKSAITNLKNKHIEQFRIKYWKNNRISKTMEIEPCYIRNNKICEKKLGKMKYIYNGKDYKLNNITKAVKINYNSLTKEYKLYIPEEIKTEIKEKKKEIISLDPGLRTFMTGVSQNKKIEIGTGINSKIEEYITRINKIKENEKISKKIKKKNEIKINRKIENKIEDLHWKTINYLTDNYDYILIGDMSAKGIVKRNESVLTKTQKVACLRTQYYKFKERLEYKSKVKGAGFNLINESYSSKTCSICGNIKEDLKGAKEYICEKCDIKMERDINGARNIFIKSQQ